MIKRIIKKGLFKLGYKISPLSEPYDLNKFTAESALKRCIERGIKINTVIDVGASDGRWTRMCRKHLPEANYLLIEAQNGHLEGLQQIKSDFKNLDFVLAAAGDKEGEVFFDNNDLFGGLASHEPLENNSIKVRLTTIDKQTEEKKLKGPFLIKLDTHGFEVPILQGALNTIKEVGLFVIEAYNYKITNNSLRYFEMCQYMENLGFSSIEMADMMLREKDESLWQMDIFFIPSNNREFDYISYR